MISILKNYCVMEIFYKKLEQMLYFRDNRVGIFYGGVLVNTFNKVLVGIWIVSLLVLFVFFFQWMKKDVLNTEQITEAETVEEPVKEQKKKEKPVVEKKVETETIELGMIGDVLLHMRLATYKDYTSNFKAVQPIFESMDYMIANQESPPTAPAFALSGYPRFSSPAHIVGDLKKVGIDMAVIANNHIIDKGEAGVTQVFKNLDAYDMPYVGVYRDEEDANTPRIIEVKGIKIAMLAYTYGTNGLYLPNGSSYKVNYIEDEKMKADIAAIKDEVDVVAVSMHWGPEYVTVENAEQNRLAKLLNDAGVDIVFGSHPHILQPYEKLTSEDGQETHVFYSISNFFAAILSVPDSMIGGVASFEITKEGDKVTIGQPKFKATANLLDSDGVFRVYPLADVENRAVRNLEWVRSILGPEVDVQ